MLRLFLFLVFVAAAAACCYFIDETNADVANIALGLGAMGFAAAAVCECLWKHVEYEGNPVATIIEMFSVLLVSVSSPYNKGNWDRVAEFGAIEYYTYRIATGYPAGGEVPFWAINIVIAALLAAFCCLKTFSHNPWAGTLAAWLWMAFIAYRIAEIRGLI